VFDLSAYSFAQLGFLVASAFVAGLARGFSGFGAALIFVPLASTVASPIVAAPLLLVVDLVLAAGLIPNAWRIADRREVGTMLIGTLMGVPMGVWILARADAISIRWTIAAMVAAALALLMSGWRFKGPAKPPLTIGIGALAGLFSGVAQVGGPPIVVYWLSTEPRPQVMRANIVLYFAVSASYTALSYAFAGVLTFGIAGLALVIGPAYGLGLFTGTRLFPLASPHTYARICYALIAGAGIVSLPILDGIIR
jgi:uncharacterized membrane protein YfcA